MTDRDETLASSARSAVELSGVRRGADRGKLHDGRCAVPEVSELELVGRVALALVLGGVIGVERELDAKTAGFRTHVLICLGAALFGLISVQGFTAYEALRGDTNVNIDITRVASQVVVGIGFLGGGAILKWGGSVRGLTTAASIWTVAAIGLAIGIGYYAAATTVTIAVLISLVGLRAVRQVLRRWARQTELVMIRLRQGSDSSVFLATLRDVPGASVRRLHLGGETEHGGPEIVAQLKSDPGVPLEPMLSRLAQHDDVEEIGFHERER